MNVRIERGKENGKQKNKMEEHGEKNKEERVINWEERQEKEREDRKGSTEIKYRSRRRT